MRNDELIHYGTPHEGMTPHSGRFKYGSGPNAFQRLDDSFTRMVRDLRKQGMSDDDIAKGMGITLKQLYSKEATAKVAAYKAMGFSEKDIASKLDISINSVRAKTTIAKEENRRADMREAMSLFEQGYNKSEIGRMMGKNESSIRKLLDPKLAENNDKTMMTAMELKNQLTKHKYLDVGPGLALELGVTDTKLKTALAILEEEGYVVHKYKLNQVGTQHQTTISALCPPGTEWKEFYQNRDEVGIVNSRVINPDDTTNLGMPPLKDIKASSIDPSRIYIRYAEDGGTTKDGVVELRRGVDDISLKDAQYAQVRIPVDGTHYIKGMAMYSDDIPRGYDMIVNTNKKRGTPLLVKDNPDAKQVLKPMKNDGDNPFGASIKPESDLKYTQRYYLDKDGNKKLSAINVVYEEGDWGSWSKTLASQMLSKQSSVLAKQQLDLSHKDKLAQFDEIKNLTNPTVKKQLLIQFANDCDASAVHLKAHHLPRQASHVILPIPDMKPNEVYAPNYNNGDQVVLIRYPHGGQFEIPYLTVNNKHKTANSIMHNAKDAIGINSKVAEQLSGADFDGDSVLVIPVSNKGHKTVNIQTKAPIEGLKDFDTKIYYKEINGKPIEVSNQTKQQQMGRVSNLITDMTLKGADSSQIARAVRHSMVVIDSEKHHLDYKASEEKENIKELKRLYQGGANKGSSTIISRAKSDLYVPQRKDWSPSPNTIDPKTGEKIYRYTGSTYEKKIIDKKTGEIKGYKTVPRQNKSTKMAEAKDARTLMSTNPTKMEVVYADYANSMKDLANKARLEWLHTKETSRNPQAAKIYAKEVASLQSKLNIAEKNAPKERQAQALANKIIAEKRRDNPNMDEDQVSKIRGQALGAARARYGAKKTPVTFTDKEWEAIQAGAIGSTNLKRLLINADMDNVKKMATPKSSNKLSSAMVAKIKAMGRGSFTIKEIADACGVSPSTVSSYL